MATSRDAILAARHAEKEESAKRFDIEQATIAAASGNGSGEGAGAGAGAGVGAGADAGAGVDGEKKSNAAESIGDTTTANDIEDEETEVIQAD